MPLVHNSLHNAPALIETVFPAQKVSFEAQRERKAGAGQTLTALGSYWKGRKPLILVRAIVLGSLLPPTDNPEKDLDIFEKLMGFDEEGLARRALMQNALKPADIAARIELDNPWDYFKAKFPDDSHGLHPDGSHGLRGNPSLDAPRPQPPERLDSHSHAGSWERSKLPDGSHGLRGNPSLDAPRQQPPDKIPVIPAWMPESSHKDVNLRVGALPESSTCASGTLPSMALDSGIHAGMTAFLARRDLCITVSAGAWERSTFPLDADRLGIKLSWRRDLSSDDKLKLYRKAIASYATYEEKAALCKRPEEVDQAWLYAPVWAEVNRHYRHLGIEAHSHQELIEQLGLLRYGHRPKVGDTFCGGGSIPFEVARLGCDVYASDLNPIACMLTWGALNIIGASPERRAEIEQAQKAVAKKVDRLVTRLGIEHDENGNRAKVYLYCLETRCPDTGWMIPMSPSWVVSLQRNVIATLVPNYQSKRFEIEVHSGVSQKEIEHAERGTIQGSDLVYVLDGKTYRTSIKTLRGDYRDVEDNTQNRLRRWDKNDFKPKSNDIFQERLYAIQWITKVTLDQPRQDTFFSSVTNRDLERESKIYEIVSKNLLSWQQQGLVPDMEIEPGDETTRLGRERGWTYWHHLFNARQLFLFVLYRRLSGIEQFSNNHTEIIAVQSKSIEWNTRLCRWATSTRHENQVNTFSNQALNTLYNFGVRAIPNLENHSIIDFGDYTIPTCGKSQIYSLPANEIKQSSDLWITDPPYADAVMYHEITEFFIAWLRKNPPKPFDQWVWDSRRALAIKGSGDEFRRDMVAAYSAMTAHMPDNGMQCVMFTHQDTGVWSDMVGIFWAAGLQVVAAWYIATETTSELKKGGYVQGTIILMLKKRPAKENPGFKQRILPLIRAEVQRQIETMMNLNAEIKDKHGEPVFNDSDLQMAGYAAALKVLTAYTQIGGEDVTSFALRPRKRGETTVVDEIVQQAAEAANNLLVPEGLEKDTWAKLSGIQRFYLRMMDMETTGASKLDNYQNFAKAFRVEDYARLMGSMSPNQAKLKRVTEFASRDLTDSTEIGGTGLGRLIIVLQQLLAETPPPVVINQLQAEIPDFMETRPLLIDLLKFIEQKAPEKPVREAAEVLGARLRNLRALGQ